MLKLNFKKHDYYFQMLLNLHKKSWMEGLTLQDYSEHCKLNETIVKEMLELAKNYNKVMILTTSKNYFKLLGTFYLVLQTQSNMGKRS